MYSLDRTHVAEVLEYKVNPSSSILQIRIRNLSNLKNMESHAVSSKNQSNFLGLKRSMELYKYICTVRTT